MKPFFAFEPVASPLDRVANYGRSFRDIPRSLHPTQTAGELREGFLKPLAAEGIPGDQVTAPSAVRTAAIASFSASFRSSTSSIASFGRPRPISTATRCSSYPESPYGATTASWTANSDPGAK